jgi:hypothetical protein
MGVVSGRVFDSADETLHDVAFLVQASRYVTDEVELFGRYAHVFPDDRAAGADDDFNAITLGANWFPLDGSRALRLAVDATYYPGAQADSSSVIGAPDTVIGLLPDEDDDQVTVRLLAQIKF